MFVVFSGCLLLSAICVILLLIGLIKPGAVPGGRHGRWRVAWTYFGGCVVSLIAAGISAAAGPRMEVSPTTIVATPGAAPSSFIGTLVYEVSIDGGPKDMLELARAGIERSATVTIGGDRGMLVRLDKVGGLGSGTVVLDRSTRVWGFRTENGGKDMKAGTVMSIDEIATETPSMVDLLPYQYKTDLKATGSIETIAGHSCQEFQVIKSGFVRPGATMRLWIAHDLEIPRLRYDFNDPDGAFRTQMPLPMEFPIDRGTVLKAVGIESGITVTYTVTTITAASPDGSRFILPPIVATP